MANSHSDSASLFARFIGSTNVPQVFQIRRGHLKKFSDALLVLNANDRLNRLARLPSPPHLLDTEFTGKVLLRDDGDEYFGLEHTLVGRWLGIVPFMDSQKLRSDSVNKLHKRAQKQRFLRTSFMAASDLFFILTSSQNENPAISQSLRNSETRSLASASRCV